MDDLAKTVVEGLRARKGRWKQIASDLAPVVSYSFISQLGRGTYKSSPSYRKLKAIADYLRSA